MIRHSSMCNVLEKQPHTFHAVVHVTCTPAATARSCVALNWRTAANSSAADAGVVLSGAIPGSSCSAATMSSRYVCATRRGSCPGEHTGCSAIGCGSVCNAGER
jgi:hypothetical protein